MSSKLQLASIMAAANQDYWWYFDRTAEQVGQLLTQNKAMLTSINAYLDSNHALKLAVVMEPATKQWWWWSGLTGEQVSQRLTENKAQLTDISAYIDNDRQLKFAVIMTPGTGTGWYYGCTEAQVGQRLTQSQSRLAAISAYIDADYSVKFAFAMAPANQTWWWYSGQTAAQVNELLTRNKAMLTGISAYIDTDNILKFAVVMAPANQEWWWRYGDPAYIGQQLTENKARMIAASPYLLPESFQTQAQNAVKALQKWYAADPYAAERGLYHWDDPNLVEDLGGSVASELVKIYGYKDAFQDTMRWWNNANAMTALIDYMLVTKDREYLSVVENTFVKAPNTFTVSVNGVEVAAIAGAAEGAVAGAALGAALAGPLGAVVGGFVGAIAGFFGGGGHAAATTARIYYKDFLNSFYDDQGWWALAWIKAYDLTGDKKFLTAAETIFENNAKGWDSVCGGGLYWQKNHNGPDDAPSYKNAIANELFLAVGAALYVRLKNETYLKWANDEWAWFQKSGLINSKHLVNDSFGKSPASWSCANDGSTAVWTYNQGVILGGLCDLYTANQSREPQLLDIAEQIAGALIQTPSVDVEPRQSQIGGNTTKSMPFVTARMSAEGPAQPGPRRRFQIQDWVYFQGTDNKLWRVRNDGSQQSQIGKNTTSSTPFVSSRGDDDWIYFQGTDNKLWRVKHDGSEQSQIGRNTTASMPFVTQHGNDDWVYFRGADDKLWRVKQDGSGQSQIGHNTTSSTPFVTSRGGEDWVYFRGTDNKLWRVRQDGGEQSQIGHNTTASMPFVMQHGNDDWVYFQGTDNKLWRVRHDGGEQSHIGGNTTSSTPHVMSIGGEDWVHFRGTDNKLWRVKYDGWQQSQIGANTTSSSPFVTAGGWVYFQGTDDKLWKVYLALDPSTSGVNAQGVLTEFTDSDPQASVDQKQFKGVFVRNLAYLYKLRPNPRYRDFILKNTASALDSGCMNAANQFGGDWSKRCDGSDFVRQTAAIDLLNAANVVAPQ
jgi:uncharacterized membrane protein